MNAIHELLARVSPRPDGVRAAGDDAGDIVKRLELLDHALASFIGSKTVEASFRPPEEDLVRVRRLRQLAIVWRDTGDAPVDLTPLAEEFLAIFSTWR